MGHLPRLRTSILTRFIFRRSLPLREQLVGELLGVLPDLWDEARLLLEKLLHSERNEEQLHSELALDAFGDRFGSELNALSSKEHVFEDTARIGRRTKVRALCACSKHLERGSRNPGCECDSRHQDLLPRVH